MITSGSQQALSLIGMLLINPGDHVLVEQPTYLGALQAFNAYQASYVGVPSDEHGIVTEHVPEMLRHGPKFMYIVPNFQNPAGTTFSRRTPRRTHPDRARHTASRLSRMIPMVRCASRAYIRSRWSSWIPS